MEGREFRVVAHAFYIGWVRELHGASVRRRGRDLHRMQRRDGARRRADGASFDGCARIAFAGGKVVESGGFGLRGVLWREMKVSRGPIADSSATHVQ
ncbi:hypothetical protein PTKU64_52090 [Paraburkholderia terrae]|uniref:Uncharacterized protein n=1 Tax=Paraburkholderia terrae TaxID=311230 RepID=A0ABM7U434_9BURK|nr:hypothetical protein PTKU64_52090 [Paraburkholderia terrae]